MSKRAQTSAGCAPWAGQAGGLGVQVVLCVFRVASGYRAAAHPRANARPLAVSPRFAAANPQGGSLRGLPLRRSQARRWASLRREVASAASRALRYFGVFSVQFLCCFSPACPAQGGLGFLGSIGGQPRPPPLQL